MVTLLILHTHVCRLLNTYWHGRNIMTYGIIPRPWSFSKWFEPLDLSLHMTNFVITT